MKVAIIGGGAAGFFAAIHAKENYPQAQVVLFERSKKVLTKVKISGGGRCNVTNGCPTVSELCKAYPRGGKKLKKAFHIFNTVHIRQWFEARGVALKIEADNRVFPVSNDSQSIIDCLFKEIKRLHIRVEINTGVKAIRPLGEQLQLHFSKDKQASEVFDKVIVATGGSPKRVGLEWLERLGHQIEDPVPSLFTFNMPGEAVRQLMGIVAPDTLVSIQGTKLKASGPLLITHWGMSGPAILKLSAFGARLLHEKNYRFKLQVNWPNERNNEFMIEALKNIVQTHPQKLLTSVRPYLLPERLWKFLLERSQLPSTKKWNELGKKGLHKLMNVLSNDVYTIQGKTTFKEEFVTCGGISLQSVDLRTMESKVCKNLYFAGEILDIDAITGGYNFQAAWTTAFIAGRLQGET